MYKKFFYFILMVMIFNACANHSNTNTDITTQKITYPVTPKDSVSDNYFGTLVNDPYRWLEIDTAAEVEKWVVAENELTEAYLSNIPYRTKIRNRLEELWNYSRFSAPFKRGEKYYFYKNNGLQNQSVLYVGDGNDSGKVFFDPNTLSADGTVSLGIVSFNKKGTQMAYALNRSGSDWQDIYVMDAESGKKLTDSLKWVKFSGIAWKDDGFFYSRFEEPVSGKEYSSMNTNQKVYFHKMGTPQSEDKIIFSDPHHPLHNFDANTTEDESILLISGYEGASSGNSLYYSDLRTPNGKITKLFEGFEYAYNVIDNIDNKLVVMTNKNAPRFKLVLVDPKNPDEKNWKTILPEKEKDVLQSVQISGGNIFGIYMQDATNHVYQYDMNGKLIREVQLPTLGTVAGFDGKKEDTELYYSFTSFTYPTTIFKYNIKTGKSDVWRKPDIKFNSDEYVTEQVFYPSKDGTKIPMFIVHKKGLVMDGNNPTYLYSYGGFDISLNPAFSVPNLILLENNAIYAMPNIRGGGEYGQEWHKAGMLEKKQTVFDDFIAAAEYLINNKYTSSEKLAISGRSNGGLLVGAVLTQKPNLMKVAFPGVGVLDMLRYHKFTIGHAWVSEYGSSDDSSQFQYLYKYSPLHNIKEGVTYPATMITTADHDDRVVPAHSFKFAATLQAKAADTNPVLIRIEHKAGHGSGKPIHKQVEEWADIWSFMFYNMNFTPKY